MLQALRHGRLLVRLMLAWVALALGVASASPVLDPPQLELVCSGGSMKVLVHDGSGMAHDGHAHDCLLCASGDGPPPVAFSLGFLSASSGSLLLAGWRDALVSLTTAPLPARGPPG